MSVDSAATVVANIDDHDDLTIEDAIERLILEVRAEMPCYRRLVGGGTCLDYNFVDGICLSCSARAELQKVAEAV